MDLRFTIYDLQFDGPILSARHGRASSRMPPSVLVCCSLILGLLVSSGCETSPQAIPPISQPQAPGERTQVDELPPAAVPTGFSPAKIGILPLSEIAFPTGQEARLHVYVALLDAFGCPIKAPCTLRFEVYEHVLRSARAKGQRLMVWPGIDGPGIDLIHPAENHKFWRDFLRAYEFQFPMQADRDKTYILEATYLGPAGRRLSVERAIRSGR